MWSTLRQPWPRWAHRVALVPDRGTPVTYTQLDRLVGRAADQLTRAGVGGGAALGVVLGSGADLVVSVLAGLACQANVSLLNTQWWPRELRAALEVARPELVLTSPELQHMAADLAPIVTVPAVEREGPPAWETLEPGSSLVTATAASELSSALTCYTAGVWSEPRPVRFSQEQLAARWALPEEGPPTTTLFADDVANAATFRLLLATLAAGGTALLSDRWAPLRTARRLARDRVERLWATGPQLNQLACVVGPSTRWQGLQRIDAVGGMLHRSAAIELARPSGARVGTALTVTEAGGTVCLRPPGPAAQHHPLDVGGAAPELSVEIIGDDGRQLPPGRVGKIQLHGPALGVSPSSHSSHHPERSGHRLCTEDLGRIDAEGNLHVLGRTGDLFRCGGGVVWPALVEMALAGHPGIADVAVVPRPDPELGCVPVAVTVPADPEAPPFLADLAPRLAELPAAWRPRAQAVVERLPLTGAGQLHRRMLAYDEIAR